MRDKLIELICDSEKRWRYPVGNSYLFDYGKLADHLIANGVTFADVPDNNVGKWIPVSERLPEETGWYRVCHKSKLISDRYFYSDSPEAFARFGSDPVTHWKPIEEPPKEGE
jgi:hypothetical protein